MLQTRATVEFFKLGRPEVVVAVVEGIIYNKREDKSFDIKLDYASYVPYGEVPFSPLYNLQTDGTVFFFDPYIDVVECVKRRPSAFRSYNPYWRRLYYRETREAVLTFLAVWRQLRHSTLHFIDKDTARIIAELVYNSFRDQCWEKCVK